jgi:hypothetical protein
MTPGTTSRYTWRSLTALLLGLLAACTHKAQSWTEEVRLANGDVVRVERTHRYEVQGLGAALNLRCPSRRGCGSSAIRANGWED